MAVLFTEGFESGTNGVAVTTTNTSLSYVGGIGATFVAGLEGALAAQISSTSYTYLSHSGYSGSTFCYRWLLKLNTLPAAQITHASLQQGDLSTGTLLGDVLIMSNGTLRLRDWDVLVGTATGALATGTTYALEWLVDLVANTQTLRVYDSTSLTATPLYTTTGAITTSSPANNGGATVMNIFRVGKITSVTGFSHIIDSLQRGNTWFATGVAEPVLFRVQFSGTAGNSVLLADDNSLNSISTTPPHYVADGINSEFIAMEMAGASGSAERFVSVLLATQPDTSYERFYFKIQTAPAAGQVFTFYEAESGDRATNVLALKVKPGNAGTQIISLFDGTGVEFDTLTGIPVNSWMRLEISMVVQTVAAETQVTVSSFTGENRHGVTPNQTAIQTVAGTGMRRRTLQRSVRNTGTNDPSFRFDGWVCKPDQQAGPTADPYPVPVTNQYRFSEWNGTTETALTGTFYDGVTEYTPVNSYDLGATYVQGDTISSSSRFPGDPGKEKLYLGWLTTGWTWSEHYRELARLRSASVVPLSDGTTFTLSLVSDLHFTTSAPTTAQTTGLNRVAAINSDYLGIAGDSTDSGTTGQFTNFNTLLGTRKSRTFAVAGNHDWYPGNLTQWFAYYGTGTFQHPSSASVPYYSFDLNGWHFICLNIATSVGGSTAYSVGSAQYQWLQADLAANSGKPMFAMWHVPRFSEDTSHGDDSSVAPIWDLLRSYECDIIYNGHVHNQQRFPPMTGAGASDVNGPVEFTSSGVSVYGGGASSVALPPDYQNHTNPAVVEFTLGPTSYSWKFIRSSDGVVQDQGTKAVHNPITTGSGGLTAYPANPNIKEGVYRIFSLASREIFGVHSDATWLEARNAAANVDVLHINYDLESGTYAGNLMDQLAGASVWADPVTWTGTTKYGDLLTSFLAGGMDDWMDTVANKFKDIYNRYGTYVWVSLTNEPDAWNKSKFCHVTERMAMLRSAARRFHFYMISAGVVNCTVTSPTTFNEIARNHATYSARTEVASLGTNSNNRFDGIHYYHPDWKGTKTNWPDAFSPNPVDFFGAANSDAWGTGPITRLWSGNTYCSYVYDFPGVYESTLADVKTKHVPTDAAHFGNYQRFFRALYGKTLPVALGEFGYPVWEAPGEGNVYPSETADYYSKELVTSFIDNNIVAASMWLQVQDSNRGNLHNYEWQPIGFRSGWNGADLSVDGVMTHFMSYAEWVAAGRPVNQDMAMSNDDPQYYPAYAKDAKRKGFAAMWSRSEVVTPGPGKPLNPQYPGNP